MKLKKYISAIIFLVFLNAFGQSKFVINYNVGIPVGETSEMFDGLSWRGTSMDFSYRLKENLAIGFSGGWQVFDDGRGYITETNGTETISGYQFNYLNSVPLYGTGTYSFGSGDLEPYISLGIGVVYNQLEKDIGLISNEEDAWQFSLRPEIGADFSIYYGLELRASLKYYYAAKAGDLPDLSFLGIGLGLVWSR